MSRRIFLAEDQVALIKQARSSLEEIADASHAMASLETGSSQYELHVVDIDRAYEQKSAYWNSLNISSNDLIVLDLHYEGRDFQGKDLFFDLFDAKEDGNLPGLTKILVATSKKGQVSIGGSGLDPDFATAPQTIDVYGMEKATNPNLRSTIVGQYGPALRSVVDDIYAGNQPKINIF